MRRLFSAFFHLLYHSLAWAYDWVAWVVSLGQWDGWTKSILPMLPPGRILELGFGPGHLQASLRENGWKAIGLDESWQMAAIAMRKYPSLSLIKGLAQGLPFASQSFQTVVSTFPAPFIFHPDTAREVHRVLTPGGKLVALLAARPLGLDPASCFIRALFRVTGETPNPVADFAHIVAKYQDSGFQVNLSWITIGHTALFMLGCVKIEESLEFMNITE